MKQILAIIFITALLYACKNKNYERSAQTFFMPAEWEPHDAVWMGWEKDTTLVYYPVVADIIKSIAPHVRVKIAFDSDSLMQTAKLRLLQYGIDSTMYTTYIIPGDRYWIRDHGATFLVNAEGKLAVADFVFNGYGYPGFLKDKYEGNMDSVNFYLEKRKNRMVKTGAVDSLMAASEGAVRLTTNVIHEGGATEVNGAGTLILCEATVFQRNPDLKREYIQSEFKRVLGVSNIIWMKQGLADDPHLFLRRITANYIGGGTGGHTDEFVRFANPSTVMLAWVDEKEKNSNPINQMNYKRMNENYNILKNAKDQNGNSFTIIKVPLPDFITKKITARNISPAETTLDVTPESFFPSERPKFGDSLLRVPAASYMNYLVTNNVVLLPSYTAMGSSKQKQENVKAIFEKAFAGRTIIFIDAMAINWHGGGIHCSTQQQPKRRN